MGMEYCAGKKNRIAIINRNENGTRLVFPMEMEVIRTHDVNDLHLRHTSDHLYTAQ